MFPVFAAVLIVLPYLCVCEAECPSGPGVALDLHQMSGDWYMIGGTPVTGNTLSRCGRISVSTASASVFTMRYTVLSQKNDKPVVFNVNGRNDGEVTSTWQLEGSKRILGPFKHFITSADYSSHISMLICGEKSSGIPGNKFAMIWSRRKDLPSSTLEGLKDNLGKFVKRNKILVADNSNC